MTTEEWALSEAQRSDTITRIRANMSSLAFFRNAPLSEEVLAVAAEAIEKKAYTAARVGARTTTGMRPEHETLKVSCREMQI